jgi:PBSX family phage terminase large subunit
MNVDFSTLPHWVNKKFYPLWFDRNRFIIKKGGAGSGKCLAKGANVIMYSGKLKKVEDLKINDLLMGIDSKPRQIKQIYNGIGNLYKIIQKKGIEYIVNENHILSLKKSIASKKDKGKFLKKDFKRPKGRYPSFDDIININVIDFLNSSKRFKRNFNGYRIGIDFDEKEINIPAYFLGLWLGDGSSRRIEITTADIEIINYIKDYAKIINHQVKIQGKINNKASTYFLNNGHYNKVCKLRQWFKDLNLICNKHIPDVYLFNSKKNRLDLLAGIIDTDGSLQGNCYDLVLKDKKLALQIKYLCNSLGYRCHFKKCIKSIKRINFKGIYYRMNISGNVQEIPVKIERKKIKKFNKNKDTMITGINVEYYGIGEFYGFELDQDGLFLLEDFTVTHNSVDTFRCMTYRMIAERGHNYLVCRKYGNTNSISTYPLFKSCISDWNLWNLFTENKTSQTFSSAIGNQAKFIGLDDIEKIKSITFDNGVLTDIIIEEANEITEKDFINLNLRLRGQAIQPFQITLMFNPISITHWLKKVFFDNPGEKRSKITIHESTYLDNRFIDQAYKEELEALKFQDKMYYEIFALGHWGSIGNLVFRNIEFQPCPYSLYDFDAVYAGQDFGFNHYNAIELVGLKDGNKYSFNELYTRHMTNNEIITENEKLNILSKNQKCTADSAEPKSIKEWQNAGYSMKGAKKGKDSVKVQIGWLNRGKWIIDPDKCPGLANEVSCFKWKEDKEGNPLDETVEFKNDAIAACRYAIEELTEQSLSIWDV